MGRRGPIVVVAGAIAVAAMSACGADRTVSAQQSSASSKANCGQGAGVDNSVDDIASPTAHPDVLLYTDGGDPFASASPAEYVAVLRVVDRDRPMLVSGVGDSTNGSGAKDSTDRSTLSPEDKGVPVLQKEGAVGHHSTDRNVVRPVRFAVERTLKGKLPACLSLDVPGGVADGLGVKQAGFPDRIPVGERYLALWPVGSGAKPVVGSLLAITHGTVRFPSDGSTVNVGTWTLPKAALASPPAPSQEKPLTSAPSAPYTPDVTVPYKPGEKGYVG